MLKLHTHTQTSTTLAAMQSFCKRPGKVPAKHAGRLSLQQALHPPDILVAGGVFDARVPAWQRYISMRLAAGGG